MRSSRMYNQPSMLALASFVIITMFLKTVICGNIIINICGDSACMNYYKQIEAGQNIAEKLIDNFNNGSSSSFSMKYSVRGTPFVVTDIAFLNTDNDSTFFKCWDQANIESVICERQTMNQCKLTLSNESCCSNRNAILWNKSSEFLDSPAMRNFSINCGNQTNGQILFVYELVHSPSSSNTLLIKSTPSTEHQEMDNKSTVIIIGLIIGLSAAVILAVTLIIIGVIILKKWTNLKNQTSCNKSNDLNLKDGNRDQSNGKAQEQKPNNNITAVRHFPDTSKDVSGEKNNNQHKEQDFYLDVIDSNIPYNVTSYEDVQELSSGYVNTAIETVSTKNACTSLKTETTGVKHKNTENGIEETQAPLQLKSMNDAIIMDKTYQELNEYDSLTRDSEPPQLYSRIVIEH
ncbi:unnamed protein product [Lymnaea stagnalis]|uniref:Uncharacterized protein n=1 Tax=Lymnaea stagnalis TaxID=6523 RepID=A0AAV2I1J4_LYMST